MSYNNFRVKTKILALGKTGVDAIKKMLPRKLKDTSFLIPNYNYYSIKSQDNLNKICFKKLNTNNKKTKEMLLGRDELIKEFLEANIVFILADTNIKSEVELIYIIAELLEELNVFIIALLATNSCSKNEMSILVNQKYFSDLCEKIDVIIPIFWNQANHTSKKIKHTVNYNVDDIFCLAIYGIWDLICAEDYYISVDLADIRKALSSNRKIAFLGIGEEIGKNRAKIALQKALIDLSCNIPIISNTKGIVLNVTARKDSITMDEVEFIIGYLEDMVHEAYIVFGVIFDSYIGDKLRITLYCSQ
ncbi:FtsZ/tubulin family protein [Thermodesulfatator autotrophicus]|uniref:Tubulin/FtsZ 2-layer sandwich domain-containing protein n=1 Tax=Thermodesulfatator autotrophicus TaxID=1795632 RepID=A0A177E4K6_9BACT|nr:hypothetical protein [Thermodesulfatator autotrophicus]OAG26728.1 hypothetical protein TH606_10785 [Thermodesulfatator autotrophicus]